MTIKCVSIRVKSCSKRNRNGRTANKVYKGGALSSCCVRNRIRRCRGDDAPIVSRAGSTLLSYQSASVSSARLCLSVGNEENSFTEWKRREREWLSKLVDLILDISIATRPGDIEIMTAEADQFKPMKKSKQYLYRRKPNLSSVVSEILYDYFSRRGRGINSRACTQLLKQISAGGRPELSLEVFYYLSEYDC